MSGTKILEAPDSGVTVRMYRQGHGDCFLLALPRTNGDKPVYVLIDCGLKPGSQAYLPHQKPIGDIVKHIAASTGNQLDLVIITHEHEDHVNGIWRKKQPYFGNVTIRKAWLAWTEDPTDGLANDLRDAHKDTLLRLVEARQKLALAVGAGDTAVQRIDTLLSLELGGDESENFETLSAAAKNPETSINKQALKLVKDAAAKHDGVSFLRPGGTPLKIPDTDVNVFIFGPPRDPDLLGDENPKGSEAFPDDSQHGLTFAAAVTGDASLASPFNKRYRLEGDTALNDPFFLQHYGKDDADTRADTSVETLDDEGTSDDVVDVPDDAPWRRIDDEWLYSAEMLAIKLNAGINNTSLVLAFELPQSRKVLFFVGDAQRGSWNSWNGLTWQDGEKTITARALLARTVLYKVGHHGSHNATLNGTPAADYANLAWMATETGDFAAMIPAVHDWAETKKWHHPLRSIKDELTRKAQGRVFQTDTNQPAKPDAVDDSVWQAFEARAVFDDLYFDYTILDT